MILFTSGTLTGAWGTMARRFLYLFIILQVLVCACSKPDAQPGEDGQEGTFEGPVTLTVTTYNVLKPEGRRSEMSMDNQEVRRTMTKTIAQTQSDIIAFNELDETLVSGGKYSIKSACASLVKNFTWKMEWPNDIHEAESPTYSYANGFAYNSAKLKVEECGYVWLSKQDDVWYTKPEPAYEKVGSPERTCIWIRMTHKESNKLFWVFVTHLPTESQGGASNMAKVVNRFAREKAGDAPAILLGDMNSNPSTYTYRLLTRYWTDGSDNAWGTMSGSSTNYYEPLAAYSDGRPDRRIDHIMTKGCTATDYRRTILFYQVDGKDWLPSDHLPVTATITIE